MIASSTLAPSPKTDLKQTRLLPLSHSSALDLGKSGKQLPFPHFATEHGHPQKTLNQHINHLVEQQLSQISDTETTPSTSTQLHQHKPLALNKPPAEPFLELMELDDTINPSLQLNRQHKPLALGQNTGSTPSVEQRQHKPLALTEKPSSLDIQLLSEQSSVILNEPAEQFGRILQELLKNTSQANPLYWIEDKPNSTQQVATKGAKEPNLAWRESLWF